MVVMSNLYDLTSDNIICGMFGGDDSLLVLKPDTIMASCDEKAQSYFNL